MSSTGFEPHLVNTKLRIDRAANHSAMAQAPLDVFKHGIYVDKRLCHNDVIIMWNCVIMLAGLQIAWLQDFRAKIQ